MKKKIIVIVSMMLFAGLFGGCAKQSNTQGQGTAGADTFVEETAEAASESESEAVSEDAADPAMESADRAEAELPDGIYTAEFKTDSGMFHINEACDGKGTLTVENGRMTIHISLASKNIVNLYPGLAEDAKKDGAKLLSPTEDTVTYSDGMTEEVYGFDVPVPALEQEFDLALIGTKGKWYDHKVSVSDPVRTEDDEQSDSVSDTRNHEQPDSASDTRNSAQPVKAADIEDGTYTIDFAFEGGSGRAEMLSPATVTITGENATATVQWDSPNYDYMIVDGEKYLPVNTDGNSVFEIPVLNFDQPIEVIGDTVAMSRPHEVEYILTFHSDTIKPAE